MKVFKNEVGRPSNEVLRKRKIIKVSIISCSIVLVLFLTVIIGNFLSKDNNVKKESENSLVNVRELSDEFMENYKEQYNELVSKDNLTNVLIVTSEDGIKDNFGSSFVVEAPNHKYYLQYDTEEAKTNALEKFTKMQNSGEIYSVYENEFRKIKSSALTQSESNIKQMASSNSDWFINTIGFTDSLKSYIENDSNAKKIKISVLDFFNFDDEGLEKINKYISHNACTYPMVIGDLLGEKNDHGLMVTSVFDQILPGGYSADSCKFDLHLYNVATCESNNGCGVWTTTEDAAFTWATKFSDVINISYADEIEGCRTNGTFGISPIVHPTYEHIKEAGSYNIITVAAAGNKDGSTVYEFPAAFDNSISVSGIKQASGGTYNHFGNASDMVNYVAPADNIGVYGYNGEVKASGTSLAAPMVTAAVAMIKSYNSNLSRKQVMSLLNDYGTTTENLNNYSSSGGWGNGLLNLSDTSIFSAAKNMDASGTGSDTNVDVNKFINGFIKIFKTFADIMSKIDWNSIANAFSNVLSSCANSNPGGDVPQEKTYEAPKDLVLSGNYYLISNYKKTKDMKKLKDYACDARSDCYAKAYYMKLSNKIPGVIYYGHCDKGTVAKGSCRDANNNKKIKYVCNYTCPNPRLATGNLDDAYKNVISNKPSIITLTNGSESHDVVIVGIKKKTFNKFGDSIDKEEAVSLNDFVVIDTWDNTVKEINANSSDSIKNIKGIGTGWTTDYQVRY